METRSIFKNISPIDHRYAHSNPRLFDSLSMYLSEEAQVRSCIRVEAALLETHIERESVLTPALKETVRELPARISPEEIYTEELSTRHNIRALVNVMKRYLPEEVSPYLHLGATSADILDTAAAVRYRECARNVILPILIELEKALCDLSEKEAETPQIGRTHGRHAVPITFGYAVAEYVCRLGKAIPRVTEAADDIRGKIAGAVGAYNAASLITDNPEKLELETLNKLGLQPAEYATQVVEPEYLLRFLHELNAAFGIIANLADDLRHLQRSEIDEIREDFSGSQVGSSTMPQKRNPWNCEHVKSLWKTFTPRVLSFSLDQISEHQRDLSNSASSRFIGEYLAGFTFAADRMLRIVAGLHVDRERMKKNLRDGGEMALAEAAYILLSLGGLPDGHERIRVLTLEAERTGKSLVSLIENDPEVLGVLSRRLAEVSEFSVRDFFSRPELYRGLSEEKARKKARKYRDLMDKMTK
jgi:adenylosuccinate lyase